MGGIPGHHVEDLVELVVSCAKGSSADRDIVEEVLDGDASALDPSTLAGAANNVRAVVLGRPGERRGLDFGGDLDMGNLADAC